MWSRVLWHASGHLLCDASLGTWEEQQSAYNAVLERLNAEGVFAKLMPDAQGWDVLDSALED